MRAAFGRILDCLRRLLHLYYTYFVVIFMAFMPRRFRTKKQVAGKVVLITGAGGDIGRPLALRLADLGVVLVLWDLHRVNNEETARLVRQRGAEAHTYVCDVSDRQSVYATAAKVNEDVGVVNILINNAGVAAGRRFLETPDDKILEVFNTNTLSHFWTCKAFLPGMLELREGHIVAVSSLTGVLGVPRMTDYTSSKSAVTGFMEALKIELLSEGYDGIKTTLVHPFLTKTGLFSGRYRGILPRLDSEYVAEEIVSAVQLDKEVLVLPKIIRGMLLLRPVTSCSAMLQANDLIGDRDFFNSMKVRS